MLVKSWELFKTILITWINWIFSLEINDNPKITLGVFLLACFFIGFAIFFLFKSDFFLPILNNGANKVEKMSSSKKGGKE